MVIKESYLLTADNTDVLAAPSRLASLPGAGIMTIEASATDCDATNYATMTLKPPSGDTPFSNLHIPMNGFDEDDAVMHNDTSLVVRVPLAQGGHVTLSVDENGTVALILLIITYEFQIQA